MPISIYCATEYKPKEVGTLYTLRMPYSYIFYVGKTRLRIKDRLLQHISSAMRSETGEKNMCIRKMVSLEIKPLIGIIEQIPIRTPYDSMYYDYKEFYWIKTYLQYGWELLNIRVNDVLQSELSYKRIISNCKNGGKLEPSDFYYGIDHKGFPIYDINRINLLGYSFSKEQFASHWDYVIDIEKYKNIQETTLEYVYQDYLCKENAADEYKDCF